MLDHIGHENQGRVRGAYGKGAAAKVEMLIEKRNAADNGFNVWTFNGTPFSMDTNQPVLNVERGRRYRLRFRNASDDLHPMHIDATILPLAPGKLLVNPERVKQVPAIFKSWDILQARRPCLPDAHPLYMTSKWINMNVLSLDHERVIVEKGEESIIKALKVWGFKPIPCPFRNFNSFGGSFHCATLDVRRRGGLESYF